MFLPKKKSVKPFNFFALHFYYIHFPMVVKFYVSHVTLKMTLEKEAGNEKFTLVFSPRTIHDG